MVDQIVTLLQVCEIGWYNSMVPKAQRKPFYLWLIGYLSIVHLLGSTQMEP